MSFAGLSDPAHTCLRGRTVLTWQPRPCTTVPMAPPLGRAPLARVVTCSLQEQAWRASGGAAHATTSTGRKWTRRMMVSMCCVSCAAAGARQRAPDGAEPANTCERRARRQVSTWHVVQRPRSHASPPESAAERATRQAMRMQRGKAHGVGSRGARTGSRPSVRMPNSMSKPVAMRSTLTG